MHAFNTFELLLFLIRAGLPEILLVKPRFKLYNENFSGDRSRNIVRHEFMPCFAQGMIAKPLQTQLWM